MQIAHQMNSASTILEVAAVVEDALKYRHCVLASMLQSVVAITSPTVTIVTGLNQVFLEIILAYVS